MIDRVHSLGGIVIANHLFWNEKQEGTRLEPTLPDYLDAKTLLDMGVDAFEVVNQQVSQS